MLRYSCSILCPNLSGSGMIVQSARAKECQAVKALKSSELPASPYYRPYERQICIWNWKTIDCCARQGIQVGLDVTPYIACRSWFSILSTHYYSRMPIKRSRDSQLSGWSNAIDTRSNHCLMSTAGLLVQSFKSEYCEWSTGAMRWLYRFK